MEKLKGFSVLMCLVTGLGWSFFSKGSYYLLVAILLVSISLIVFLQKRDSFFGFLLICSCLNNLYDELFSDPTKLESNEIVFFIILPFIYLYKRQKNKHNG